MVVCTDNKKSAEAIPYNYNFEQSIHKCYQITGYSHV